MWRAFLAVVAPSPHVACCADRVDHRWRPWLGQGVCRADPGGWWQCTPPCWHHYMVHMPLITPRCLIAGLLGCWVARHAITCFVVQVSLADLNAKIGQETAAEFNKKYEGRACFVACDVTNKTQLESAWPASTCMWALVSQISVHDATRCVRGH